MTALRQGPGTRSSVPPRTAVLACAVLEEEVRALARERSHLVHFNFLEQGLHNTPDLLRLRLQEAVDRAEARNDIDAIALVYGLCSRGIEGVRARLARLVAPRAHDCITLLLGDRHRYAEEIREHPGTYWYSPGWIHCRGVPGPDRADALREQYRTQFGDENADYLVEVDREGLRAYQRAAYVDLGTSDPAPGIAYTQRCAEWLGWAFERVEGNPALLRDLLDGNWDDERFLVLAPGRTFRFVDDDRILIPAPVEAGPDALEDGHA